VERGDTVLVLDDLSSGRRENLPSGSGNGDARIEVVEGSVLDEVLVEECMDSVDACFHLASTVGVKLVVSRPLDSLLADVRGLQVVTDAAARHGVRMLFTSTSEVYGKRSDGYVSEDADRLVGAPAVARWNYSTAKTFGEALLNGYHRERGAEMTIVRIFNTIGPKQSDAYGMVLPRFVSQALSAWPLTVYGDGSQSRCFIHVADSVAALTAVMDADSAVGGTFNIGCDRIVRIVDLAREVIKRSGSSAELEFVPYEQAYGDGFEELGCRRPDTTRLREATGWAPTRSIEDAIDDTIAERRAGLSREAVA
jgi:UDP-glucose 4-epimerase